LSSSVFTGIVRRCPRMSACRGGFWHRASGIRHGNLGWVVGDCLWWLVRLLWLLLPHIFHILCLHHRRATRLEGSRHKDEHWRLTTKELPLRRWAWQEDNADGRSLIWQIITTAATMDSDPNPYPTPDRPNESRAGAMMPGILIEGPYPGSRHTTCALCFEFPCLNP